MLSGVQAFTSTTCRTAGPCTDILHVLVAKVLSVLTVEVTVLIQSQNTWMEGPRPTGSCRNPAVTTVTFVTGFTTRLLTQISTKLEMLTTVIWELHWQNEIVSLLTIPMPSRLKNYAIIIFFAPSVGSLKCRRGSRLSVSFCILTLQSSAKGQLETQRQVDWQIRQAGKRQSQAWRVLRYTETQAGRWGYKDRSTMRCLDKAATVQRDLENGNQADCKRQRKRYIAIQADWKRGRQTMEDWDPGLGVVRWAVVAGERVVWSRALNVGEWVIGGRLFCWVSLWDGRRWRKEGRILFTSRERERDRQTRGEGVRESVDDDSGPRTTWWWRREGGITHQSMWNLIRLSQDWQCASPHGCCSAAIQPPSLPRAPAERQSASLYRPRTEQRWGQGEPGVRFTQRAFYKKSHQKPVRAPRGIMRHKPTTNKFCNSFVDTTCSPLSRSPGHPAFRSLSAPDECMLKILHHYLTKPFKFQQRLSNSPPDKHVWASCSEGHSGYKRIMLAWLRGGSDYSF